MSISQPISTLTINNEEIALAKSPYIGNDGFWYVFDEGTQTYKKSSSKAAITGNQGPQGIGIKSDEDVSVLSGNDKGKLQFTLYNPAATEESQRIVYVKTSNSVQGVGISNIVEITEVGDDYGKLRITTTDPTSGDTETYLTDRITGTAGGFGQPTATVDEIPGHHIGVDVTVDPASPDTAKVFNFAFHNIKGAQGIQGVQGYQGNMITDIDVINNQVQFTLHDPKTGDDSTITAGEISPVTVNSVSPSGGNITITGEDISIDDSPSAPTIADKIENIENNYVSSNTYANYERAGIIQIGNGIYLSDNTISVRQQDVITVDRGLSTTSENPVQNKAITSAINGVREDMSELVTGVSMVNQKTGNVSLYADDIQINSSSIVTLKDLIHLDTRDPNSTDAENGYANSLWINTMSGNAFYYGTTYWGTSWRKIVSGQ